MKPEANSRRLFGITRSKGKMFEFGLPAALHIAIPEGSRPEELFPLTVGTLGDTAAVVVEQEDPERNPADAAIDDLRFSAGFFDAYLASKFSPNLNSEIALLASATYYLAGRPGSSLVLSRGISAPNDETPLQAVARWLLQANWTELPTSLAPPFGESLHKLVETISRHYRDGTGASEAINTCAGLRSQAYRTASSQDLFLVDIISAVVKRRMSSSTWTNLPSLTGIPTSSWSRIITRNEFPKELWPAQLLIGKAGIFSGSSGLIQMPTSAGKTKSIEIIIRSIFMSGRGKLAIVIAPFRALCHEISNSLRGTFDNAEAKVNELSDALQLDYLEKLAEILGIQEVASNYILVLTPEKFLYILRQTPTLVNDVSLVIYDEGHQFDSGSRGITYELLLTEIKKLLPSTAQTILISAVIQNAAAIGNWLIGENAKLVQGKDLSPTTRSVAFASWAERLGQLMFYETASLKKPDYFVPRIIEQRELARTRREKAKFFPERGNATDVALYLGLQLAGNGAAAIFCGRKATASKFAARAVEVYERNLDMPSPAGYSDQEEISRLKNLYHLHFGEVSTTSKAASLGIFSHHGNTPHGIRLSVEYAMQRDKIRLVACTSTLAQGVNLPIRYLIVSGVYQGAERIKTRDFHNLMGRAGRAGKHTEGLVIFSDPAIYDSRMVERWRMKSAAELLNPELAEPTTSSLLSILGPFTSPLGNEFVVEPATLCRLLLHGKDTWHSWATDMVASNRGSGLDVSSLIRELNYRRKLIVSIESYLMANRGPETFAEYSQRVTQLAVETLAYHLADEQQKSALVSLFISVAEYIQGRTSDPEKQVRYGKTLLGVEDTQMIEAWASDNKEFLLTLDSNESLLGAIWPLFSELSQDGFFRNILPQSLPLELVTMWIKGNPYKDLFAHAKTVSGTKPWGQRRAALKDDDIIEFCESTLGFECPLIVGAVLQFLFNEPTDSENDPAPFLLFQKAIKYGIPDLTGISCYESGFADRMLAQSLRSTLQANGYTDLLFLPAVNEHRDTLSRTLREFPSYFETVLARIR